MDILKKIRPEEQDFLEDFQEMVVYHIKQMQQCLLTAGKLFCEEEEEKKETGEKEGGEEGRDKGSP